MSYSVVLVKAWPFFHFFSFYPIQATKMGFTIFQIQKTLFQAIKTRTSKSRNIEISLKGLVQGFGKKLAIQASKMGFTISQIQKRPFQAITTRSSKSRKIEIFTTILSPWFRSKIAHFNIFYFRTYRPGKCVLLYSRTKKRLYRL